MLALVDSLGPGLEYGYLLVEDDPVSEAKIRRPGPVYRVRRPRDKQHQLLLDAWRILYSGTQAWRALRAFRPQAVVSTGPSVAVPVSLLAKVLRIKVVFVETASRVTGLSLTGRIMYHVADLFFVQWPALIDRYPRAIYAGRFF
jgi:beta-1,4-N-acetylglucosaminyltransferase